MCAVCALTIALAACGKSKSDERRRDSDDDREDRSSKRDREKDVDTRAGAGGRFRLDVTSATVDETLTAYRRATGNDLGMKDSVRKRIDCVRVTLSVERDSAQDVERALGDKLGEYGLKIEERTGLTGVVRDYAKPSPCALAGGDEPDLDPLEPGLPRTPRTPLTPDPPPEGIEKISDNHFRIERTTFEALKADAKAARTVPRTSGTGTKGLSLFGIKHNGILYALGFRNGDVVQRVNGMELSDPTKVLDAYAKLKDAAAFVVEVERRRSTTPVKITIEVVPDGTVGKPTTKVPSALP